MPQDLTNDKSISLKFIPKGPIMIEILWNLFHSKLD